MDNRWTYRSDTRSGDMAHGITFHMLEREGVNIRGELAVGPNKIHVDGKASLTIAQGQYQYGDELIAQLYTRDQPVVLDRRADGWARVQVYLGPADLQTAAALELAAQIIRSKIGATA